MALDTAIVKEIYDREQAITNLDNTKANKSGGNTFDGTQTFTKLNSDIPPAVTHTTVVDGQTIVMNKKVEDSEHPGTMVDQAMITLDGDSGEVKAEGKITGKEGLEIKDGDSKNLLKAGKNSDPTKNNDVVIGDDAKAVDLAVKGNENITGKITAKVSDSATAKVEIDSAGTVKTTDSTGAKTVELANGAVSATDTVTVGNFNAETEAKGVELTKEGVITSKGADHNVVISNGDVNAYTLTLPGTSGTVKADGIKTAVTADAEGTNYLITSGAVYNAIASATKYVSVNSTYTDDDKASATGADSIAVGLHTTAAGKYLV